MRTMIELMKGDYELYLQYDDGTAGGGYSNLRNDDDSGPISGISAGDIVIPGAASASIDLVCQSVRRSVSQSVLILNIHF